jgi:hypothetical protein
MKAYLYVISTPLGLVKVGAAANPKQRVQNLQIGSPVPLTLAGEHEICDRPSAEAVAAALQERFRSRRERGHWFRATPLEVRKAIGDREIVDLYRSSEAKRRQADRLAAETAKAEAAQALASASAKERRRLRQQRRRAAAGMLAAGLTQVEAPEALGVTDRTIRNWTKDKAFQRALARAQARAERQEANAERRAARRRAAREQQNAARRPELRGERDPDRKPDPRRAARPNQSDNARSLDQGDARLPLSRAHLHSRNDDTAARIVAAGGGIQAIIEATGLRTRENVLRRIDPAILEQAHQNDAPPPATPAAPG